MSNAINLTNLQSLTRAYVFYEVATHGCDPRDSLEGTVLRKQEGYKYGVYDAYHERMMTTDCYVDTLLEAMPGENLVSYHQKRVIERQIEENGPEQLENALAAFYQGQDDSLAFGKIVDAIGGFFDILGFICFLKDSDKYLPIRSRLFDDCFRILGLESNLEGNCTWEKYAENNSWIGTICNYLKRRINPSITMIDAHSFIWMLPDIEEYIDLNLQIVENKRNGKGVLVNTREDGCFVVRFGKEEKVFVDNAFSTGILTVVPNDFKTHASEKELEIAEALLKLIANRRTTITYGELSEMTASRPSPYYELNTILDDINKKCDKLGLPYISAMVVNKGTGLPGEGLRTLCINSFGYNHDITTEEIFHNELSKISCCDEWGRLADEFGIEMPDEEVDLLPEELAETAGKTITEGAKKTITVNAYERDPRAVKQCKDFYMKKFGRITCQICGFDFGKIYGPEYANKIHFHHIKPLSEIGETYEIKPTEDLIPVCPNCHLVLHAGRGIGVDDLKNRIRK